jgi:hypothetical protein
MSFAGVVSVYCNSGGSVSFLPAFKADGQEKLQKLNAGETRLKFTVSG